MSYRNPTGREWIASVSKKARQVKRDDPDLYAALMWARDSVLDAASIGQIDLAQPVTLTASHDGRVHVTNAGTQ